MEGKEYIQLETAFHGKNLEVNLCHYCNYKCNYCYCRNANVAEVLDIERLKDFIDISNATSIVLLGGEPTLYPNLLDLLDFLKEKEMDVSIITNNTVGISWWKKHIHYFDKKSFKLKNSKREVNIRSYFPFFLYHSVNKLL